MARMDTRAFRSTLETHGIDREVSDAIVDLVEESREPFVTNDKLELEFTKHGGEIREEMSELRSDLRGEMSELRSDLRGEMAELRSDIGGEMKELRSELRSEMTELRSDFRGENEQLRSESNAERMDLKLEFAQLRTEFAEHRLHTTRLVLGSSGALGMLVIMLRFLPA